jgi:signal peptidase I
MTTLVSPSKGAAMPSEAIGPSQVVGMISTSVRADSRTPPGPPSLGGSGDPQRRDLVLCRVRGKEGLLVKRVVGVSGGVIELRDNRLSINGEQASSEALEPAEFAGVAKQNRTGTRFASERIAGAARLILYDTPGSALSEFGPFTVCEGQHFLLGDNRDNRYDSRDAECGSGPARG